MHKPNKDPVQRAEKRMRQRAAGYKALPGKKNHTSQTDHFTNPRARKQQEEAAKRMRGEQDAP